jgi:hypothetical protein
MKTSIGGSKHKRGPQNNPGFPFKVANMENYEYKLHKTKSCSDGSLKPALI